MRITIATVDGQSFTVHHMSDEAAADTVDALSSDDQTLTFRVDDEGQERVHHYRREAIIAVTIEPERTPSLRDRLRIVRANWGAR